MVPLKAELIEKCYKEFIYRETVILLGYLSKLVDK